MEDLVLSICNEDVKTVAPLLSQLLQLNDKKFNFPELNVKDLRIQLWSTLFEHLQNPTASSIHTLCLANVRILSRDKANIDDVICEKWINVLLELSGLYQLTVADDELPKESSTDEVKIEALKCMCNLIYNSQAVQMLCASNCLVEGIISRLRISKISNIPQEVKFFDMKLLFIITALRSDKRDTVKDELHGLAYLVESLDEILKEITPCPAASLSADGLVEGDHQYFVNDAQLALTCEILKIVFNLVIQCKSDREIHDQDETYILRLVSICNTLLLCTSSSEEKTFELHNNVVNFLTSVPSVYYSQLAPVVTDAISAHRNHEYDGRNMESVHQLVNFLQLKISQTQNVTGQNENLSPILTAMHKSASSYPYLRKYLRAVVLPPLKDVHTRPEEGNTVRNQLCRLLTTPVTHVRDLAAQFLFILCKENVSRMVKYTGYGNAAGLFATRGLLAPNKPSENHSQYSSDSDDSDTEEYRAMRHTVNPVTGCYEPPHVDPMAGCTEEQKEYEAMKLVNLMDQLNRAGIVQPCRIGADGKPEPVEHILQLQEELPNQQLHKN